MYQYGVSTAMRLKMSIDIAAASVPKMGKTLYRPSLEVNRPTVNDALAMPAIMGSIFKPACVGVTF
ncbi:unannotated protein [freshwater metagenome]|uniref:Unannotated protein n=1 Tax=freshwater metagenome TaxID=449393 RepID=A0A6J7GSQ8_9ZZZZ